MAMSLHLKIITPLRTVVQAPVQSILLPSVEGQLEILPGHASIISAVANGELIYRDTEQGEVSLFVGGGFLQVEDDTALLVTDTAMAADEMDPDSITAAIELAQKNLRNSDSVLSREEQLRLEALISKQLAMLEYNSTRRKR